MSREPDGTLEVLRTIWHAQGQTSADLDDADGNTKACKRMAGVGFGDLDGDGEVDVRAAWRARLEREGKLTPGGSLADLILGPGEPAPGQPETGQPETGQPEGRRAETRRAEAG